MAVVSLLPSAITSRASGFRFYDSFSLPHAVRNSGRVLIVLGLALAVFVKPMKKLMGGGVN